MSLPFIDSFIRDIGKRLFFSSIAALDSCLHSCFGCSVPTLLLPGSASRPRSCSSPSPASIDTIFTYSPMLRLSALPTVLHPSARLLSCAFANSRQFSSMPAISKVNLLFRQLFEKESSTYTYLLADVAHPDKPAVLVDPVDKTIDRDLNIIKELGVKLIYAMNTHVHADHVTGTGLIKSRMPGVQSLISKASGAKADAYVDDGDKIQIGNLFLEVRATPGHTEGCVTYVTGEGPDQPYPRMAFTGDTLLIRACGRTDFQGGDARQLYRSVHSQIFTLPKETLIYPAHDYKGQTVTTVGEELLYNPRLTKDEEAFKSVMDNLGLAYPKMFDVAVPANMVCGIQDMS